MKYGSTKSTAVITPQGFSVLQDEADHIQRVVRPEIVAALSAAAAEGDRSENAEYIYRKKQLRGVDRRLRYVLRRLNELKVIRDLPTDQSKVYFGAWVEVENDEGELKTFRLVGPDEVSLDKGWISIDAPMSKGLLGKTVDDEVAIRTPVGRQNWVVVSVRYAEID